jgi:CheY-like chemotaxis protein
MENSKLLLVVQDVFLSLQSRGAIMRDFSSPPNESQLVSDFGLDLVAFSDFKDELENRLGGRDLDLTRFLIPEEFNTLTLRALLAHIQSKSNLVLPQPLIVYVDDEEENLFVFRGKYGKRFNLKTFTDPLAALEFIRTDSNVVLVITDEVMPNLSGNMLCDEVQKVKPAIKFILITGNPNNDHDLLYNSLRKNRFYEFISKPVDFEKKGEEYFQMIQGILHFSW